MNQGSYRYSHADAERAELYDTVLYSADAYDAAIWEIEKAVLEGMVRRHAPNGLGSYLDFACGTGRVLSELAPFARDATGLDISEGMLTKAREKTPHVRWLCGDVTHNPALLAHVGPFDTISCFRFFLNAEPVLRVEALAALLPHLRTKGLFICNNHGNSSGLLGLVLFTRRLLGMQVQNGLGRSELKRLLESHGLQILETRGAAFLPRITYRLAPRRFWTRLERMLGSAKILDRFAIYQILLCRKL